jgi:lipopolysaccharide transport system permease protein
MNSMNSSTGSIESTVVIEPKSGWQIVNLKELKAYRDLFYFLVWRNIKVVYAQTILGFSWAILEPLIQILLFTVIFGKVAQIDTDGIPYFLFSSVAIVPWSYMSQAMAQSSDSLVGGGNLLSKVYFPRLIFPITPAISKLMDFGISMAIVVGVLLYYQVTPTMNLLLFPLLVALMICVVVGFGMWASALAIRFRDVRLAMPFFIRMFMYSAPIVYSASSIPETYRLFFSLNPLVGIIEGFRACLLGLPVPWASIAMGLPVSVILFLSGALYFKRMEKVFVDVL